MRHWIINVLFGLTIAIGLYYGQNSRVVVAAQNWALDTAMQGNAAVDELRGGSVASLPMAFIDIDEETWRSPLWGGGEPFRAPRDGLLTLIKHAINSKARYIVLDVIIEGRDSEDQIFADKIKELVVSLRPEQNIFFVRTLREPLPGMQELLASEIRPSSLDEVIRNHPQLHAVAPYFRVSRDGVLREWQMWQTGCGLDATGKRQWQILPSAQLAISALVETDKRSDKKTSPAKAAFPWDKPAGVTPCIVDLASYMQIGVPASKLKPEDTQVWKWLRKDSGIPNASEVELSAHESVSFTNRIFYRFRYQEEAKDVHLISALAILENRRQVQENEGLGSTGQNGVVVIGQSFEAAREQHATPIGVMPGPMVLINSLASMLNPGLLQEPPLGTRILIELTSIGVIGFLLAYLDYIIAFVVILVLFVPSLIYLNYWFLHAGEWVEFGVPLLGMYGHWLIVEIEAYLLRRRPSTRKHVHQKEKD